MLLFTEYIDDPKMRYKIGWAYTGFVLAVIVINWAAMFGKMLAAVIGIIKRYCPLRISADPAA